jgi:hypothetical protein
MGGLYAGDTAPIPSRFLLSFPPAPYIVFASERDHSFRLASVVSCCSGQVALAQRAADPELPVDDRLCSFPFVARAFKDHHPDASNLKKI